MTRTIRVTFSADTDTGEGFLTERASFRMAEILNQGWMFARDVFGDWAAEIARMDELAIASYLGWLDKTAPDAKPAQTNMDLALRIWRNGVWPDMFNANSYTSSVGKLPKRVAITEIDKVAASYEFWAAINDEAERDAKALVKDLREEGVAYSLGDFPNAKDLQMFYMLKELVGGDLSDDPRKAKTSPKELAELLREHKAEADEIC